MLTLRHLSPFLLLLLFAAPGAQAQTFKVQCPTHTRLHPLVDVTGKPNPAGDVLDTSGKYVYPNPGIKCQQISGGDGFATMGDGTQTYLFSFGPLSGLGNLVKGLPATVTAAEFMQSNVDNAGAVLDAVKIGAPDGFDYGFNGAIGLVPDTEGAGSGASLQAIVLDSSVDSVAVVAPGRGYANNSPVWFAKPPCAPLNTTTCVQAMGVATVDANGSVTAVTVTLAGNGYTSPPAATVTAPSVLSGHVDPRLIMDVGVMNGNIPAPLIAIDEGDELFLTLTNVGQIMRPDLFEQHTVHFHGYPNASAFYDGVPDASLAINVGGSFTYYYLAPEAGTYMWHCHISPPEHLQMGMVGQLYVRPKQSSLAANADLGQSLLALNQAGLAGRTCTDVICAQQTPLPAAAAPDGATGVLAGGKRYAYNDGDGSTQYDVEYPIQLMGFDPNFHFVGMTFNPESFADNKDKYFLMNGRSYPDTVNPAPLSTQASDGTPHFSQPLPTLINIPLGGKALLRISDLNVTEYHTLASLGMPMHVVGLNARLLRDLDGNNTDFWTNSISLAGGESVDVILDASDTTVFQAGQKFYLYTPQFDHLSNDAENFGGMMTEINICASVDPVSKACGN
ncbi:MAG: multicopper oxidase domain-containing protein [Rubrivivax sp.]